MHTLTDTIHMDIYGTIIGPYGMVIARLGAVRVNGGLPHLFMHL